MAMAKGTRRLPPSGVFFGTVLVAMSVTLMGCGGGGGDDKKHGKIEIKCAKAQLRAHCAGTCIHDLDANKVTCTACNAPYKFNNETKNCEIKCSDLPKPADRPGVPDSARELDGFQWPDACFDDSDEVNFFAIGDWGGICGWPNFDAKDPTRNMCQDGSPNYRPAGVLPGKPFPMDKYKRMTHVDLNAQTYVANKMMHMYKNLSNLGKPPKFVINAGDSFYPGGIEEHCSNKNGKDIAQIAAHYQFKTVFEDIYKTPDGDYFNETLPGFNELEWWGVLGNHDYGGTCYIKAWDQVILYTWKPGSRWVMPAPYWKRHVQFKRFDVDFFFIDTNVLDVEAPADNPQQNICYGKGSTDPKGGNCPWQNYPAQQGAGDSCPATQGPMNPDDCVRWFHAMWAANKKWLDEGLAASTADWQVVVGHYPVKNAPPNLDWKTYAEEHGIDLIITGHQHFQKVYYMSPVEDYPQLNLGETAHVITGGGGGIQTDLPPREGARDDSYGYMVMEMSVDQLQILAYTHAGGIGPTQVLRNHTVTGYRERKETKAAAKTAMEKEAEKVVV